MFHNLESEEILVKRHQRDELKPYIQIMIKKAIKIFFGMSFHLSFSMALSATKLSVKVSKSMSEVSRAENVLSSARQAGNALQNFLINVSE